MNNISKIIVTTFTAAIFLNACTHTPLKFEGAAEVRTRLTKLQNNPTLAHQSPMAMQDASVTVLAAEQFRRDPTDSDHFLYLAERRVDIAEADSLRHYLQQEYQRLHTELVLKQILIAAKQQPTTADLFAWKTVSVSKKSDWETLTEPETLKIQQEDRGLVMTFNNIFLQRDQTVISDNATTRLSGLVAFLVTHSGYITLIEGHTDEVDSDQVNTALSLKRANTVKSYLISQGVSENRITIEGKGGRVPIEYTGGKEQRQKNNRIEIIINESTI